MLIDLIEIPEKLKQQFNSWKSERDKFLTKAKEEKEYYFSDREGTGTNYTREQLEKIASAHLVPVSINYIYPQVAQKAAIINQNKYSHKITSFDDRYKQISYVMEKAKDAILNSSEALIETREAIKEC